MAQPTAKTAMARDPEEIKKYRQAQDRYRRAQPGSDAANRNAEIIKTIGSKYGLNWQARLNGPASKRPKGPTGAQRREQQFRAMNPQQQTNELRTDVGALANQAMYNAMQFNPNMPFQGYEQPFSQEMARARESVMNEFNRTMQPEFQRQDQEFNQRMLEQGIDPNSENYQAQYRALKEGQNQARQGAMANAFQLGAGYQQQGFGQGLQAQMLPFQQYQATENLWALPYQTETAAQEAELNRQAQLQASRMGSGSAVQAAQIQAQAQRDIAAMQQANNWQNQPKPNYWGQAAAGFAQGIGAGLTNSYMNRG